MRRSIPLFLICLMMLSSIFPAAGKASRETPIVEVVREWGPSVVNISTEKIISLQHEPFWSAYAEDMDRLMEEYQRRYEMRRLKLVSIGSGVIIDESGLVVTNAHVVKMASQIFVTFSDGTRVEARLLFIRHQDDLAILGVEPPFELKSIPLAKEDSLLIGETVIAIGNPFGLENTVTTGVLSGKNRNFYVPRMGHVFSGLIQTDAAMNLGSSGGALLNVDGELIGINLTVAADSQGIGFAVSSEKIRDILQQYQLVDRFRKEREEAMNRAIPGMRS